jgi:streptogrisin D
MARFRPVLPRQSVLPAVLVALAGTAVVVSAGPAVAAGQDEVVDGGTISGTPYPGPFSTVPAEVRGRMLAQRPLHMAAAKIRSAVEGGHARGFAGITLRAHCVEVFWRGALPKAVTKAITRARKTVAVKVTAARYSRAALKRATAGLVARIRADPGGPMRSVEIPTDGSGLVVGVEATSKRVATPPAPVRVKVVEQRFKFAYSRLADTPRFWGGAEIVNQTDHSKCTSGFGVTDGKSNWILTAGHCAAVGDAYLNGNSTLPVGTAVKENDYDLMLISSDAGGRIYWYPASAPPFFDNGLGVASSYLAFAGEYVCQSGFISGPICGLRITGRDNLSTSVQDPRCLEQPHTPDECWKFIQDLDTAERVGGGDAAENGDSGGPVFVRYFDFSAGEWRVRAVGIISGTLGPIGGGPASTLAFQDVQTAQSTFGVSMLGP